MAKVRILITGKVQGVFFRQSACQQAKILKIAGWIKNLPDGSVLSEAIGLKSALFSYISWCKNGSPRAQVANTIIEWLENEDSDVMTPITREFKITN